MGNRKYINTLDLIETIQNKRQQTLEYINKAKRNIFNSDNTPSTLESYILFRGRTVDDLLLKHSTRSRHKKKKYEQIIQKLHMENWDILVNKLIWEDQKILCKKINKILSNKGQLTKSDISNLFNKQDTRGIIILKYINEGGILLDQNKKNGFIVMKIKNLSE